MSKGRIEAREILDSRGNPTVEVKICSIKGDAIAKVPSGVSTGKYEALELRDGTMRFHGKGVTKAVKNVSLISNKIRSINFAEQQKLDRAMINFDGTPNKSRLGANAILGISMAAARAAAIEKNQPLYKHLGSLTKKKTTMPVPFCNVINGGKHAGGKLAMQEFMIVPVKAKNFQEAAQWASEVYHILKDIIKKKYGLSSVNVGDEGGFAPDVDSAYDALNLLEKAVSEAGYSKKIKFAIDAAASEFYSHGKYIVDRIMSQKELLDHYIDLIRSYPVISLEDPFDQDDFNSYKDLMKKARIQIVGDDLLATNATRIQMALDRGLCNALLLKVNQIGTITEALEAANLAMKNKWNVMVSHRSGETDDTFIADLAVALGCGQIKIGAPCRGERIVKFNRLMEIENELGSKAKFARW